MRSDQELFPRRPIRSCRDSNVLHLGHVLRPIHLSLGHRQSPLRRFAISPPHLPVKSHEYSSSHLRPVFRNECALPCILIVCHVAAQSSCVRDWSARESRKWTRISSSRRRSRSAITTSASCFA